MKYYPYIINCLTNLHAGSNGESHAIIDKTIQRDLSTGFPTIFSSSLKGALREHFEHKYNENSAIIQHIFGAQPTRNEGDEKPGKYRFFSAHLLCLPVRSNVRPFYRATCPAIINDLQAMNTQFGLELSSKASLADFKKLLKDTDKAVVFDADQAVLEDETARRVDLTEAVKLGISDFLDENPALMSDAAFLPIAQKMPVIARNQLENGISENLWYEEVVPRQTRFFTLIGVPDNDEHWSEAAAALKDLIQIGGNASIGYGVTRFSLIQ